MAVMKFTGSWQRKVKPGIKLVEYFAENFQAASGRLGLRVSPKGRYTWFVAFRETPGGNLQKKNLGLYPDLSFKEAKQQAAEFLTAVHNGYSPASEASRKKAAPTMSDLWEIYTDERKTRRKSAATIKGENRFWKTNIQPEIGDIRVEDITPLHLSNLLSGIAKRAPISANRVHSLLSVLFKPALARGIISVHPLQWIDKPAKEKPRSRILDDTEIRTLWPHLPDFMKLGLLTCQRPMEIYSLRWEDIDGDIWTIRNTKTGNDHLVPLSESALTIIQARPHTSQWVFPSRTGGHLVFVNKTRSRIQQRAGVTGWTSHDLRRTGRTLMAKEGVPGHIAERILNHSVGGVEAVYDRYSYLPEMREGLNKLDKKIKKILIHN